MKKRQIPGVRASDATAEALFTGAKTVWRMPLDERALRVRLERTVRSDPLPRSVQAETIEAPPGVYKASMNTLGAVTIIVRGQGLGVKPGEFHFECPFLDGALTSAAPAEAHRGPRWILLPRGPSGSPHFYVQEPWYPTGLAFALDREVLRSRAGRAVATGIRYRAAGDSTPNRALWERAATLPASVARTHLEVSLVVIVRLHDMTNAEAQAEAEGVIDPGSATSFYRSWERRYGRRYPWASNPWVREYHVRRVSQ